MKDSNKKSSGIEESKDKEGLTSSNQDQPESALQNLVETGETGGPIKKVTGYATLKDLGMLTRVNKKFQSAMNKEIKQRELFIHSIVTVDHTLLLAKTKQGQNKLYAYGKNNYGQLGLGDRRARNEWTEATLPEGLDLEQIIVGYNQSFLKGTVGGEDKLYACGRNRHGQLGLGDNEDRTEWTEVPLPRGFTIDKVMAGGSFAFLTGKISGQDKLYACGGSRWGELGLGDRRARNEWTEATLPEGFKIEEVMAGYYHSFLKGTVDGEDKLYVTGNNDYGQLGLGDTTNRHEWTKVALPPGFSLENVACRSGHSFLKGTVGGEDKLYACGRNRHGQLGLGDRRARNEWTEATLPEGFKIEEVMAGYYHSFLKGTVDGEDKLYVTGNNNSGQLGLGNYRNRMKWTEVPLPKEFEIEKVIVGEEHTLLKGKGKGVNGEVKLYVTGNNDDGQLGLGDFTERKKWTEVPIRNMVLKSIVSQEEASMNKKKSGVNRFFNKN